MLHALCFTLARSLFKRLLPNKSTTLIFPIPTKKKKKKKVRLRTQPVCLLLFASLSRKIRCFYVQREEFKSKYISIWGIFEFKYYLRVNHERFKYAPANKGGRGYFVIIGQREIVHCNFPKFWTHSRGHISFFFCMRTSFFFFFFYSSSSFASSFVVEFENSPMKIHQKKTSIIKSWLLPPLQRRRK